jgi:hypothetical protein
MNAFNKAELESTDGRLLESCDRCGGLIHNWDWMGWSFLTFDGKIICNNCRTELLKVIDIE